MSRPFFIKHDGQALPNASLSLNRESPQARGLVEAFPFQEGGGTILRGLAGSGIEGSFESTPTWVKHPYGKFALQFSGDGFTDKVNFGAFVHPRLSFDWDTPWTIWIRCRPDVLTGDESVLFSKTGATLHYHLHWRINTDGTVRVISSDGDTSGTTILGTTTSTVTAGNIIACALTNDGTKTAAGVLLYVYDETAGAYIANGFAMSVDPIDSPSPGSLDSCIGLGGASLGLDEFDGLVDGLRFYHSVMTPTEFRHSVDPDTRDDLFEVPEIPQAWGIVAAAPAGGVEIFRRRIEGY